MDNNGIPLDKAELIAHIEREWTALLQTVEQITPGQMTTPDVGGWSPRDNLAHLAAWEQVMLRSYLQGQPPHQVLQMDEAALERMDENEINQVIFERNRLRSVEEVLKELHQSHAQVLSTLEQMTFADLMAPNPDDPQGRPLIIWVINNTYEHYQEHRQTLQALTKK
jgi:hypothetical protein